MDKRTFRFIQDYAGRCKGKMILSVICSVLSVCAGFIPYIAVYRLLISFLDKQANMDSIVLWCMVCFGGYFLKLLFFEISTLLSHISAYTILEMIRLDISDKLLKLPLGFVINKPIGKLKNIMIDRVETIELPLAHLIPEGIAYALAPVGVFIYLLSIHWGMALASLITIPIVMVASGPSMRKVNEKYDEYMKSSNHMNSVIIEYIEGIEVIKTFNQSDASYEKYSKSIASFRDLTIDWFKSMWVSGSLLTAVMPSTLIGVLPIGMYLYKTASLTPAELVLCIILSMGLIAPMMGLTTYINSLKMIQYAVDAVDEVLAEKELEDAQTDVSIPNYEICFQNVTFRYQQEDEANVIHSMSLSEKQEDEANVIHNMSFSAKEGDFTALIGPSGGGKSTMARLISRFWDASAGTITIGGVDIKEIPLSELSQIISYVAQDNYLFNCSLKENIRLGNPKASDEEVYKAAKEAMCHEFIMDLENGYDTMAGEAGDKLSGGEKQRIAIARMILRNAPIVILDEATAFTDPENEDKIQQAIGRLTKGKTLLVIAHRLSTIKHADKIAILENGEIKQIGTHEELLEKSKMYESMWQAHIGAKTWAVAQKA